MFEGNFEFKVLKTFNNAITRFYPGCNGVFENLDDKDKGFFISFEDGSYTYLMIDTTEHKVLDDEQSLWVAFAYDNFNKSRYFRIVYDSIRHTFEIVKELTVKE